MNDGKSGAKTQAPKLVDPPSGPPKVGLTTEPASAPALAASDAPAPAKSARAASPKQTAGDTSPGFSSN